MSTLSNPASQNICVERLSRLQSATARRWGRMTPHQMMCHLNDSFGVAAGTRYASPATGVLQRTAMRWVALHTPLPWPKGIATRPEIAQDRNGTPPIAWDLDQSALERWITGFPETQTFAAHPIFGKLTRSEWMIWGFRHVDHHFRQFGI
jgi:hypothetical protein